MSLGDTFKTYNPSHGVRTAVGGLFIFALFILFPLSLGIAIIHNQLRLRKRSK